MKFYGRQDITDLLIKRADAFSKGYRQNIAITGDELIGKSSLIKNWLSEYCNNYIVPVYVDMATGELRHFAERFIASLLFSFLKNSQDGLKGDIGYLLDKASKYIPRTSGQIERLLNERKARKNAELFNKLLELPEILHNENGKRCIIILDEFHKLQELSIKDIYLHWRKQIILNKNTMYILASSKKQLANKILSSDLDLLFGNFEKIELKAFDNKTALDFVRTELKTLDIEDKISDFIVYFTSANPFYLDALCGAFRNYHALNPGIPPDINSLISSWDGLFADNWGILHSRFSSVLREIENTCADPVTTAILTALASGHNSIPRIAQQVLRPKKYLSGLLGELCASDYITKNSDIYTLDDKIFSFWLRHIHANKSHAFTLDCQKQKQAFREKLTAMFTDFCDAQAKAISQRILELFNQFGNEAIEVHKKRLRLNRFKEVKLMNMHGRRIKSGILARTKNSIWITGLKEDKIIEEDMLEFADVCRKFRHNKSQKRIFIALSDIEANASLIAKEEKISTWDSAFINSLLDMYGKPRIIR